MTKFSLRYCNGLLFHFSFSLAKFVNHKSNLSFLYNYVVFAIIWPEPISSTLVCGTFKKPKHNRITAKDACKRYGLPSRLLFIPSALLVVRSKNLKTQAKMLAKGMVYHPNLTHVNATLWLQCNVWTGQIVWLENYSANAKGTFNYLRLLFNCVMFAVKTFIWTQQSHSQAL